MKDFFAKLKTKLNTVVVLSKFNVAIIALLFGICATVLVQDFIESRKPRYGGDFVQLEKRMIDFHKSSFVVFDNMAKEMDKMFEENRKYMQQTFVQKADKQKDVGANVTTKQDEKTYQYELSFFGYNKDDIKVDIKKNKLTFVAQKKEKNDSKYSEDSFKYSFSIPKTNKKPQIIKEDNKITVVFEK